MPFGTEKHSFGSWLRKEVYTFEQTPGTRKFAESFTLCVCGGGLLRVSQEAVEGLIVELGTRVLEGRPVCRGSGGPPLCHPQPSLGSEVTGKPLSALKGT